MLQQLPQVVAHEAAGLFYVSCSWRCRYEYQNRWLQRGRDPRLWAAPSSLHCTPLHCTCSILCYIYSTPHEQPIRSPAACSCMEMKPSCSGEDSTITRRSHTHYKGIWFLSHKSRGSLHMCEINFVVSFITMYNMCLYFALIIVKHSQKFRSVFGAHIKKGTFTVLHQRDLRFLLLKRNISLCCFTLGKALERGRKQNVGTTLAWPYTLILVTSLTSGLTYHLNWQFDIR
jgi:hypothetical protein